MEFTQNPREQFIFTMDNGANSYIRDLQIQSPAASDQEITGKMRWRAGPHVNVRDKFERNFVQRQVLAITNGSLPKKR